VNAALGSLFDGKEAKVGHLTMLAMGSL